MFSWSWPPGDFFGCDSQDTNEYNNVRYNPWNYWWYHMGGHVKFKQSFDLSVTANVGIRVSGQAKVAGFKTGTFGGTAQQETLVCAFVFTPPPPLFIFLPLPLFLSYPHHYHHSPQVGTPGETVLNFFYSSLHDD